jgi:hypothetical protein
VVGTSDSEPLPPVVAPASNAQEIFHSVELTSTHSPGASEYVSPDVERGFNSELQPYNAMLQPEGASSSRRTYRGRIGSDLGNDATEVSRERSYGEFRSIPSPAPVEEESDYGHLPSR